MHTFELYSLYINSISPILLDSNNSVSKTMTYSPDANGRGQFWHGAIEHFGLSQYLMNIIFIYFLHFHYITIYYYMCMYQ